MYEKEILDLFKVVVVGDSVHGSRGTDYNYEHIAHGFVTDFDPTVAELQLLKATFAPLNIKTLFSVSERENSNIVDLLGKQFLHYLEVYGLDRPGLFNLEVDGGKCASVTFVRAVTLDEFGKMVQTILYRNAPVKDAPTFQKIVDHYQIEFDINKVENNELRVMLFDIKKHTYLNGDDAMRYLVYKATGNSMLIKSKKVIESLIGYPKDIMLVNFLEKHSAVLPQVFNRHKDLFLSLKGQATRSVINRIARKSKTMHVPIIEGINKRFVRGALGQRISNYRVLDKISIRDKFKYLNLLEYKKEQCSLDAFVIRNGKVHLEPNRPIWDLSVIDGVIKEVLKSLEKDLISLRDKKILLDGSVHYGLPISRKQTLGQLPFGTKIIPKGMDISSGIYWENAGGARDLDLSAVDPSGNRTGWGMYSGYDKRNPINFSGDVTSAPNGAMEFMTSKVHKTEPYGLFVNIYAGEVGAKMQIVIGEKTSDKWIGNAIIREDHILNSKGNIIGFVKDGKFVVYTCRLNNSMISGGSKTNAILQRGLADFWTINRLLVELGIDFDVAKDHGKVYDHDLTYGVYTLDRLENMFSV